MNVALAISPTERRLRDRIDELEETVRQLLGREASAAFPSEWGLTPSHIRMLNALYAAPHGFLSLAQIFNALDPPNEVENEFNLVRVQINKLRNKLLPLGITINTRWGQGYELPRTSKDIIREALAGAAA